MGIFDQAYTNYLHQGSVVTGDVFHCDNLYATLVGGGASGPFCDDFSPSIQGAFSFVGTSSDLRLHVDCDWAVIEPTFDASVKVEFMIEGLGSQDLCQYAYTVEDPGTPPSRDHYVHTFAGPEISTLRTAWVFLRLVEPQFTTIDLGAWEHNWVHGANSAFLGSIGDAAGEDHYTTVGSAASVYVVADPSGDGELQDDKGVPIPVTDGQPVLLGDLRVTRDANTTLGPDGKDWTIEHLVGLPFAADIHLVEDGRLTKLMTYSI